MRRFCVSLVLAAMSVLLLASTPAQSEEGLVNPGFESGTEGWVSLDVSLQTSTQARSGSASLELTSPSYERSVDVFQWRAVQPGWSYEFSAWVVANHSGIDQVFLRISWLDAGYSQISATDSGWLTSQSPSYRPMNTGLRAAPHGAAMARVGVYFIASGPFAALVDDANLAVQAAPSPPPTVAPTPPPQPPIATPTPPPNPGPTPRPSATPRPTRTPGVPTAAPGDIEPTVFDDLTNGSFELIRDDGTAYGWRNVGGQDKVTGPASVSGIRSLELSSSTPSTKWAYQTVRVTPGSWVNASAWAKPVGGEAFLRLSWYASEDGSGQALDSDDSPVTSAGSSFERLSTGSVQVPAEARTAKLRLMLRPDSEASALVLFDDAAISPAEPAPGGADGAGSSVARSSTRTARTSARLASGGSAISAMAEEAGQNLDAASGATGLVNNGNHGDDRAAPIPISSQSESPWETPLAILVLACLSVIGAILFRELIREEA